MIFTVNNINFFNKNSAFDDFRIICHQIQPVTSFIHSIFDTFYLYIFFDNRTINDKTFPGIDPVSQFVKRIQQQNF